MQSISTQHHSNKYVLVQDHMRLQVKTNQALHEKGLDVAVCVAVLRVREEISRLGWVRKQIIELHRLRTIVFKNKKKRNQTQDWSYRKDQMRLGLLRFVKITSNLFGGGGGRESKNTHMNPHILQPFYSAQCALQ